MKVAKTIHAGASIVSGPASQIAPDLKVTSDGEEPFLLGFVEVAPDGSQDAHFYVLDQGGKENVMKHLTGGLVAAGPAALAGLPKMQSGGARGKSH